MNQFLTQTARRRVAQIILCAFLCNIPVGFLNSRTRNPGVNRLKPENPPMPAERSVENARPVAPPEVPGHIRVAPPEELDGLDLRMVLCRIIEEAEREGVVFQLPQGLVNCHKCLERGEETVSVEDLAEALPLIVSAVATYNIPTRDVKGPRPDAPANTVNNAIVGPGSCDLAPVLQLINLVKCKLEECCDELEKDFRETWTILADINDSSTICCDLLLQDFQGTFSALDACCEQILTQIGLLITPTIVIDLTSNVTIILHKDNQETWTILADIKQTLTECCADLQEDFRETWTILADINDSSTICCDLLQEDFRQTWTLIEGVQETLCRKFEETWTILADLKDSLTIDILDTLTECCTDLQQDFRETWTLIEGVNADLCRKFQETWTLIGSTSEVPTTTLTLPSSISGFLSTTTFSVIDWLKAIYFRLGELSGY